MQRVRALRVLLWRRQRLRHLRLKRQVRGPFISSPPFPVSFPRNPLGHQTISRRRSQRSCAAQHRTHHTQFEARAPYPCVLSATSYISAAYPMSPSSLAAFGRVLISSGEENYAYVHSEDRERGGRHPHRGMEAMKRATVGGVKN